MVEAGWTSMPARPGADVRYAAIVEESRVNRQGWADVVRHLIHMYSRGNIEAFARLVEINPRTIRRWLDCATDVTIELVLKVADRTGQPRETLFRFAGWLGPQTPGGDPDELALDDEEARIVRDAPVDEQTRGRLSQYVVHLRERDKRARIEDIEFFLSLAPKHRP